MSSSWGIAERNRMRADAVRDFAMHVLPTEWAQRALEWADAIERGERYGDA